MNSAREEESIRIMERRNLNAVLRRHGIKDDPDVHVAIEAYAQACVMTALAIKGEHQEP